MKRIIALTLASAMALSLCGCGTKNSVEIIGGADGPTAIFSAGKLGGEEQETPEEEPAPEVITEDQALAAIKNYCHEQNPDLAEIEESEEYPVYWEVESSTETEIVVLFRSYTAAQVRYYIDVVSGDTYVTEFVQGVTPEEEKTDESFNVKDYL